jgi:hypothetical protein
MHSGFLAAYALTEFADNGQFVIDTPFQQLVVGTFARSLATYRGIVSLMLDGLPTQAAMLARSLFEDVIVGHWLVLNEPDPDWLVERFLDHRAAMELHRVRLSNETGWNFPPVTGVDIAEARRRQNELRKTYGREAQKNWWDPGELGRGQGPPIHLRGVAAVLEDAAASHTRFHPRFAGGDEPMLRRMELVVQKWFSQCLHHTAIGLPLSVAVEGNAPEAALGGGPIVSFASFWLFSQQIYLLHDFFDRPHDEFNAVVKDCYIGAFGAAEGDLKPFPFD